MPDLALPVRRVRHVPFVALDRAHALVHDELEEAFRRVTTDSAFILGAEVEAFEREFAGVCGTEHAVGVASGTAALTLALRAAAIGPGDEVIVPAHTYIASALAVVHAGASPVFCDVEDGTGLIDPAAARAAVTPRTAAVIAVHLYGQACDMDAVEDLARTHGLFLLEDAAQAHGATHWGRPVGSLGHAAAFSFYPSKNLGALGDGGAVCTGDQALAEQVRRLRNLGQRHKGEHVVPGFNERLDGLQAALLRVKLPGLAAANALRREHAARYDAALKGRVRLLEERLGAPCAYHVYPIRVPDREALGERLAAAGVATGIHYALPAHRHDAWQAMGLPEAGAMPAAEAWAREELSLPMFPELTDHEIDFVATACRRALSES